MRIAAFVFAFAGVAAASDGADAQDRQVRVSDMIGRTPDEVSERLHLKEGAAWLPHLGALLEHRPVVVVRANTLASVDCPGAGVRLQSGDGQTYPQQFLFLDGRLMAVIGPPQLHGGAAPTRADTREARRRPPGPLPLETGVQVYVDALAGRSFAASQTIRSSCSPPLPPVGVPTRKRATAKDVALAPLALAYVASSWVMFSPYLATRPFEQADRAAAARAGPPLLATLRPGEPLPGGEAAFRAASGQLVRWHASDIAPDYAVATINLGGGRAGSSDFASVGVRAGRVEWISPLGFPWGAAGLCQDSERRPSAMRKGCTETGHYRP